MTCPAFLNLIPDRFIDSGLGCHNLAGINRGDR
jgi:hypothetical protein